MSPTQFYRGKKIMKRLLKNIFAASPKKSGLLLCITLILGMSVGCSAIKNDSPKESAQTVQTAVNADSENNAAIQIGVPNDGNADIQKETEPINNTDIQTGSAQETAFETIAYIKAAENGSISFDRVEWVEASSSRAEELGITEDDAPSGFYIYNQEELTEKCSLSSACSIIMLDWENSYKPIEISADNFFKLLGERGEQNEFIPYIISIENGEIIRIEEHYVP